MEEIKEVRTRNELADYIGVPRKKLSYVLYVKRIENLYESFEIPKKNGGFRQIHAPKKDLKQIISNGLAISCEQDSIIISIKFTTSTEKIPENKIERFSLEVVNYTINKTQELLNEKVINPETGKSTYKYGDLIANSVRKLSPATKCEVRRGSIKTPIKAFFLSLIASYVICFFIYIIKKNNELYNKVQ